jgi:hypothetical protein
MTNNQRKCVKSLKALTKKKKERMEMEMDKDMLPEAILAGPPCPMHLVTVK